MESEPPRGARRRTLSIGSSGDDDADADPDPDSAHSSRLAVEHTVGRRFRNPSVAPALASDTASTGLPAVLLDVGSKRFTAMADVAIAPAGGGRAKFRLALPPEFEPEATDAPFCLLVECVELTQFSCSQADAACQLVMDSAHMCNVPWARTDGDARATEMISCFLPFGQLSGPSQLRRLYNSRALSTNTDSDNAVLQRELRYGRYRRAAELVDTLAFDAADDTGRYMPPPDGAPEPLAYTLFRTNPDPDAPLAPDDAARPTRAHFAHMVSVLDAHYFEGPPRTARLYAHQLSGQVVADRDCKVRLAFALRVVRLRATPVPQTKP
jgi:hypothetical protein